MQKQAGFSLIEMIVVIAIMAIIMTIAIPNFFGWGPEKRLEGAASDIQGALHTARLGALKENSTAAVDFDIDDESYTVTVNGRTVRTGQMPAGVDLFSVTDLGTVTPTSTVGFDSRGLANPSVDIRVNGNGTSTPRRIRLNLSGSSKIFRE
jgi:prepilin-type N-terminal cleavage/methylation domain-containing protein